MRGSVSMRCQLATGGFLLCAGLAAAPVLAEEKPVELDQITITAEGKATDGYQPVESSAATLRPTAILDVPQAVNVVSGTVLKDQASHTLDEALSNISGISQANTLGGTQDAVIRRGFGGNRDGSILTDGLKTIQPRSFNITTDRVEVLKGPASTLYGILDPGGVVNVVTKVPEYQFGGTVTASASSFGGGTESLDFTGPIQGTNFAWRLAAEYSDVDYWRNFGVNRSVTVAPSLSWRNDSTSVTLAYLYQRYRVPFDRGTIYDLENGHFVDVDPKIRFDEDFNQTNGQTNRLSLAAKHQLAPGWDLSVNYSFSRNTYSDNQARVMAYDPETGDVRRRVDATQGSTMYAHAFRADVSGDVMLGGLRNELLFGASYDNEDTLRTDLMRCANLWNFNIYDPVYGGVGECTTVSAADSDQTEKLRTGSLYFQDSLHLSDRWILVGGMRYQNYDLYAGKGRPFSVNTDSHGQVWLPSGGIVWKYAPNLSFYANAGRTFRPQSSIGSYYGSLPPERGLSYELGAKLEMAGGVTANAAIYTSDKKNVAYSETVNGETVVKTAGLVRAKGFEVDVAGKITDRLSLIASYGYTNAKVKDDPDYAGKRPVNVPMHTGSLYLSYDYGPVGASGGGLRFGGGVRGVGARAATNENNYSLPGYAVADLFAAYTFEAERPVTVQLNLKNIFDKTYYTSSIGNSSTLANQIGEPFSAEISATVRF